MKTRIIETDHLLRIWNEGVETILFPSNLVKELNPSCLLIKWADDLPQIREKFRHEVDSLVENLLDSETPEKIPSILRKTDPRLVSLYYDRIEVASFAIEKAISGRTHIEIPASWYTFLTLLIQQKRFQ